MSQAPERVQSAFSELTATLVADINQAAQRIYAAVERAPKSCPREISTTPEQEKA